MPFVLMYFIVLDTLSLLALNAERLHWMQWDYSVLILARTRITKVNWVDIRVLSYSSLAKFMERHIYCHKILFRKITRMFHINNLISVACVKLVAIDIGRFRQYFRPNQTAAQWVYVKVHFFCQEQGEIDLLM